jgi:hypothetical protein
VKPVQLVEHDLATSFFSSILLANFATVGNSNSWRNGKFIPKVLLTRDITWVAKSEVSTQFKKVVVYSLLF